jgi:hypothetical protein
MLALYRFERGFLEAQTILLTCESSEYNSSACSLHSYDAEFVGGSVFVREVRLLLDLCFF